VEQLARIEQLHNDADRKRQEFELAPGTYRLEHWKTLIAAFATVALTSGALGAWVGSKSPPTVVIQQLPAKGG
jgi:hypothetical protein